MQTTRKSLQEFDVAMPQDTKVKVYVPVGVPGSGKSTLAKYIAATEEKNLAIFSSDKTRQRLFDEGIVI